MKQLIQKLKKNWIRVWLIVIAAACFAFVGIAAYTEVSSVKRVVSTTGSPGDPFSSNCMKTTLASRRMTSTEFPVSVCNFDQDHPTKYSPTEITYVLKADLRVKTGNRYVPMSEIESELNALNAKPEADRTEEESGLIALFTGYVAKAENYKITKTSDDKDGLIAAGAQTEHILNSANGYSAEFGTDGNASTYEKLREKRSSTDIFVVTIDSYDIDEADEPLFFVYVTAEPKSGVSYPLYVRLFGTHEATKEEVRWSGSISDSNYKTADYDFYNYVITGSGEGTLDILWDPQNIEVNKFFLIENGLQGSVSVIGSDDAKYGAGGSVGNYSGWKIATLSVNSSEVSRYELQLYKAQENLSIDPSMYIRCEFTPEQN